MAVALLETRREDSLLLQAMHSDLLSFAQQLESSYLMLAQEEVAATLVAAEELSKAVGHLQTVAARAAEDHKLATVDAREAHKSTAEYLRAKIGISRSEANRRLRLGQDLLPEVPGLGAAVEAPMPTLGAGMSAGAVSSRAATLIRDAVDRVRAIATSSQLDAMEHHLTRQAIESDEDVLRALARRWESVLDQDGQEPTEKS